MQKIFLIEVGMNEKDRGIEASSLLFDRGRWR